MLKILLLFDRKKLSWKRSYSPALILKMSPSSNPISLIELYNNNYNFGQILTRITADDLHACKFPTVTTAVLTAISRT